MTPSERHAAQTLSARATFRTRRRDAEFDPATETSTGVVLGIALASYRGRDGSDRFLVLPGDDVKITLPTAGTPPEGRQRQRSRSSISTKAR